MEKRNPLIRSKGIIILLILGYLSWSSWRLMGDPNEVRAQLGFGLGYLFFAFVSIHERIHFLKDKKIPKIKLNRMKSDFKNFYTVYAILYVFWSGLLFVLCNSITIPQWIGCSWLLGFIFLTQGACFLYLVQYIDKHKAKRLLGIFEGLFILISIIFGWISAQIAYNILELSMGNDLFTVTYGQLILPIIFILYFDYVFNYKSKTTHLLTDIPKAFRK